MNKIGAWLVTNAAFTGVSAVSVNNVFTSDYENYRLVIKVDASSTSQNVAFRFRASGTDSSASYYFSGLASQANAAATDYFTRSFNASSATIALTFGTGHRYTDLNLYGPQLARATYFTGSYTDSNSFQGYMVGGGHNVATAYDGFSLFAGAGSPATIGGEYWVYGLRD
jgi:hypothetical protein